MKYLFVNPNSKRKLPATFRPGKFDVICARGKAAHDHEGNIRFRSLVQMHQEKYASAPTKYHKSQIVSFITNAVRKASPEGGFVKLIKGAYYEVGDRAAKEKIGQTFRDLIPTKYSSSTKAKAQVRIKRRLEQYRSERTGESQSSRASEQSQESEESDEDTSSSASVVSESTNSKSSDIGTLAEKKSSKEWSDSLKVLLDQQTPPLSTFFRHGTADKNTASSVGLTTGSVLLQGSNLLDMSTHSTSLNTGRSNSNEDQAPQESLFGSLSLGLDQPSPSDTFAKYIPGGDNKPSGTHTMGITAASAVARRGSNLFESSSLMLDHPSPFGAFANNRSDGIRPPHATNVSEPTTATSAADASLFESLTRILDHPCPIATSDSSNLAVLEPLPLREGTIQVENSLTRTDLDLRSDCSDGLRSDCSDEWQLFFEQFDNR